MSSSSSDYGTMSKLTAAVAGGVLVAVIIVLSAVSVVACLRLRLERRRRVDAEEALVKRRQSRTDEKDRGGSPYSVGSHARYRQPYGAARTYGVSLPMTYEDALDPFGSCHTIRSMRQAPESIVSFASTEASKSTLPSLDRDDPAQPLVSGGQGAARYRFSGLSFSCAGDDRRDWLSPRGGETARPDSSVLPLSDLRESPVKDDYRKHDSQLTARPTPPSQPSHASEHSMEKFDSSAKPTRSQSYYDASGSVFKECFDERERDRASTLRSASSASAYAEDGQGPFAY